MKRFAVVLALIVLAGCGAEDYIEVPLDPGCPSDYRYLYPIYREDAPASAACEKRDVEVSVEGLPEAELVVLYNQWLFDTR